MRLCGKTVAQPVLAGDRHIQQRGPKIKKGHIKSAPIESHNGIVSRAASQKPVRHFRLVRAKHKLDRAGLAASASWSFSGEQHLLRAQVSAFSMAMPNRLGGQRP